MMIGTADSRRSGARHVEAVEPRQPEVEHDQVRAARVRAAASAVGPSARRDHVEAGVLEVVARELDDPGFVVDDEDRAHRADPTQAGDVEPGPSG